jgi:hypothetical protein
MRLTNGMRDVFVRAVMDDVPSVDYEEQARAVIQSYFVRAMPPKVRAVYNDPQTRVYLERDWRSVGSVSGQFCGRGEIPADVQAQVAELMAKHKAQQQQHRDLRSSLYAVARSCHTRKALAARLPEFAKYMPSDGAPPTPNLPVANLVPSFIAAGWPKGTKE